MAATNQAAASPTNGYSVLIPHIRLFSSLLSSPFPKTKKDLTRMVPLAVNVDYGVYVSAGSNVNGALEAPSKIKRSYWPEGLKYWPHVP